VPELPEVETIKRKMSPQIIGRSIQSVLFLYPPTLQAPTVEEFNKRVVGRRVVDIARRGKYLLLRLDSLDSLLVHLRMTGSFLIGPKEMARTNHVSVVICFDGGICLYFTDPRRFAKFLLVSDEQGALSNLGVEPLSASFTVSVLVSLLSGKSMAIKAFLMEQSIIAGIGNMYADEALFEARLHPLRVAGSLSFEEADCLYRAIVCVLTQAIEKGGASVSDYSHPDGSKGKAQESFKVAHRKSGYCLECGGLIERITIRSRGTYYCPFCQRL